MNIKKISIIIALLGILIAINAQAEDFYDINTVNNISITFAESNWDQLLDDLYAAGGEERLTGTAVINGVTYKSVGIRYKGNSTYQAKQIKNPLNIKLDYIIEDQTLDGYGTLKLANVYKDPSFVREVLSYEIARKYMPASQANFINVNINGSYIGLYTSVQDVDKYFLKNNFGSKNNAFFKGEVDDIHNDSGNIWGYIDANETSYYDYYEMESDEGWDDLIEFLNIFNNSTSQVEEVLDVDRLLWMLAFDILTVNLDSPVNVGHNFYLYKDGTGRFNPILWDLNENFGGFTTLFGDQSLSSRDLQQMDSFLNSTNPSYPIVNNMPSDNNMPPDDNNTSNIKDLQEMDAFLNSTNSSYPIINKILSNSTYKKMYIAHMKTIIDENFTSQWYKSRVLEIQGLIDAHVQADTNKFFTYADFSNNIENSVSSGRESIVGITELMEARITYLNSQAEFQSASPVISNIIPPSDASSNSTVWFSANAQNATLVQLGYHQGSGFEKVQMYDDGMHQDGSANDGVYGVSISIGAGELAYYIYAENNDAAAFSPVRAEYEFYTLSVTNTAGDLVINEFMADNETIITDQDEEYEDWIELYNNSDSEISLKGYYLTDESAELTQWTFPDVSIAAGEYLIVWADKDEDQDGLHANFKLSASGESILLADSDQIVIDEITFGEQMADISMARNPNGTGDFTAMSPTFSAENVESSYTDSDLVINEFMAENETTVTDQDGEYEDWIEVYNNSDSEISLKGYYLTDESAELTQWTFPDVSIAAGEYLIVWADKDEDQDGLHANFKLSASGESILLADSDQIVIDEITFGEQTADISMARNPNGTGDFTAMSPTFSAENGASSGMEGDVDGNGLVDLKDAILALKIMTGITPSSSVFKEADVNGDDKIGLHEVLYILSKSCY
ncbi:spore coat protein H [Candidatus Magnetomoraceae bacterium gMMP-1]